MYTASQLTFTQTPRAAGRTTGVVVHHAASPAAWTVDDVHRSHLNRGWIGCGYHLLQTEDGQWHEGRPIGTEGAHATGYNRSHIGVALIGNFDTDEIPAHRYDSLIRMLSWLLDEHELEYTAVRGHRELPGAATLCPGRHIDMSGVRGALYVETLAPPRLTWQVVAGNYASRARAESEQARLMLRGIDAYIQER